MLGEVVCFRFSCGMLFLGVTLIFRSFHNTRSETALKLGRIGIQKAAC